MITQQQIDDPGQWRVGDVFEGEYEAAGVRHKFGGEVWSGDSDYSLFVGGIRVRDAVGLARNVTGHVTRTVEPIPEPTVPWALVRFADGAVSVIEDMNHMLCPHKNAAEVHGAPVAVSLPRWSDEVDGLLARAAEVLGAHWYTRVTSDCELACQCGHTFDQTGHRDHQARMLADAGLLAESAPVAGGNGGARSAEDGERR